MLQCVQQNVNVRHLAFSISLICQVRKLRSPEFPCSIKVLGVPEEGPWDKGRAPSLHTKKTCLRLAPRDTIK